MFGAVLVICHITSFRNIFRVSCRLILQGTGAILPYHSSKKGTQTNFLKLLLKITFSGADTRRRKNTDNLVSSGGGKPDLCSIRQTSAQSMWYRSHSQKDALTFCQTSFRIFLDKKYCIHRFYHQTTIHSHENLLLHFKIKTRPCRWCNRQHHVGAACRLLWYHHPAKFMLWPRDLHISLTSCFCSLQQEYVHCLGKSHHLTLHSISWEHRSCTATLEIFSIWGTGIWF